MDNSANRRAAVGRAAGASATNFGVAVVLLLALVGVFYRFAALDKKAYWHDEVYTSIYLSGYKTATVFDVLRSGKPVSRAQALFYQSAHSDKTLGDTLRSLRAHDPHHPPFYYAALWLWTRVFGDSVWWTRAFSAVCGVLVLPAFWWLCRELFESRRAAWIGLALMAVSPFHVLYSQEARPYSIWALAICIACAALLQACRTQKPRDWAIFCVATLFGLYTHLLFTLVVAAQILWFVLTTQRRDAENRVLDIAKNGEANSEKGVEQKGVDQKTAKRKAFAIALGVALLASVPFVFSLVLGRAEAQSHLAWVTHGTGFGDDLKSWSVIFGLPFFDLKSELTEAFSWRLGFSLFGVGSLVWTKWRATRATTVFVLSLFFCSFLPFVVLDLVYSGRSAQVARFLIPALLALQLGAVFVVFQLSQTRRFRGFALVLMTILLLGGLTSCENYRRSFTWWNTYGAVPIRGAVRLANASPRSLFLTDDQILRGIFLSLARTLPPTARSLSLAEQNTLPAKRGANVIREAPTPITLPRGFSDYYIFDASPTTLRALRAANYKIAPPDATGWCAIKLREK